MSAKPTKSRHVYKSGAAGCGGKAAPTNAKNTGQPLPCPHCDRIFKHDGRLKDHLRSKHGDELAKEDNGEASSQATEPSSGQEQSSYPVKTPKNLLHEWCQKNGKPTPKYKHVEVEDGFHCRVIIPDAKKSESDIILWYKTAMPSSQEAHHRAAVVALHHVMGNRRLDRILPEGYREQWRDLDIAAAENEERNRRTSKVKKTKLPQRELQSVFMSEENRRLLEDVLAGGGGDAGPRGLPLSDVEDLRMRLRDMGFGVNDVQQALEQTGDISGALDWLMLNVEEDRLPVKFAPQSSKSSIRVMQRAVIEDASDELAFLMSYGYSDAESKVALEEAGGQESALSRLFYSLLGSEAVLRLQVDSSSEFSSLREEESMALSSIFENAVITNSFYSISIRLPEDAPINMQLEMEVRMPTGCLYPFEMPVIAFRGSQVDDEFLRGITRKVSARGLELLGTPMIFELACCATESCAQLLSSNLPEPSPPSPLKEIAGSYSIPSGRSSTKRMQPTKKVFHAGDRLESEKLKREWEELRASSKYAEILAGRKRLPAYEKRNYVLTGIQTSVVSIICGETGCGKSTQIPQYLLEDSIEKGRGGTCNIICTQPRRISAIGLADRVAKERYESVGKLVGYSVRLNSCHSKHTKLLYCTTGIILRRLLSDPELVGVNYVIVDEVHERTLENDLLLLLLRSLLKRDNGRLRVILMSATVNATAFAQYFENAGLQPTVLYIPGFTYPVRDLFLEDALELTGYKVSRNSRYALKKKPKDVESLPAQTETVALEEMDSWEGYVGNPEEDSSYESNLAYNETTRRSLDIIDESVINFELIEAVICAVLSSEGHPSPIYGYLTGSKEQQAGSVLVFLPGMLEIKRLQSRLQSSRMLSSLGAEARWVLALHGSLSGEEQSRVFVRPPPGVRKIVLATNVAETSITIDDVVYVIDTGRHKETSYDHSKSLSCLKETWISKANAKQRAGRAGRVQSGYCFKLYSRKQFNVLEDQQAPEVLRVSLEGLSLKVKSLLGCTVGEALSQLPTPPDVRAVAAAIQALKDISAFDQEEKLTPLGHHLAQMPVDARVAKMLIFGCLLRCLGPIFTIAAALSGRPVFVSPFDKRQEASAAKLKLSGSTKSDHMAIVAAYNGWLAARGRGAAAERDFISANFLSREALEGIEASRADYQSVLCELGFVSAAYQPELHSSSSSIRVIKAVLCAGFYPQVARVKHPEKLYSRTEGGTIPKLAAAHEVHYYTKSDGRVFVHPSSVNFGNGWYESPWLVVTDKVETSKVFLRECSMVPAYGLLIFGGQLEVKHEQQIIVVDGWLQFEAPARIAVLIKELRRMVDRVLLQKIEEPSLDISSCQPVSALLNLIDTDGF